MAQNSITLIYPHLKVISAWIAVIRAQAVHRVPAQVLQIAHPARRQARVPAVLQAVPQAVLQAAHQVRVRPTVATVMA